MKFVISILLFFLTAITVPGCSFENIPIRSGSITYPIINATSEYTFVLLETYATPALEGPSCVTCMAPNCTNPCSSAVSNPENCQCVLAPNEQQWLNNMMIGDSQSISLRYAVNDSSGNHVQTFTLTIYVDIYTEPEVSNESGIVGFGAVYSITANNSIYSGPCWAIVLAAG